MGEKGEEEGRKGRRSGGGGRWEMGGDWRVGGWRKLDGEDVLEKN